MSKLNSQGNLGKYSSSDESVCCKGNGVSAMNIVDFFTLFLLVIGQQTS